MNTDRWLGVMLEAHQLSRHRLMEKNPLDVKREGESLLLAGTQYGHLALLDPSNRSIKFSTLAHGSAVSLIKCSPKKNQVITASQGRHIFISQFSKRQNHLGHYSLESLGKNLHVGCQILK